MKFRKRQIWPLRVIHETSTGYRYPRGAMIYAGRFACRVSLGGPGRFGNGSRFFSGWSDWTKDTTP